MHPVTECSFDSLGGIQKPRHVNLLVKITDTKRF